MSKIIIYIGEDIYFDANETIGVIGAMAGVSAAASGKFIGAIFQCKYSFRDRTTTIRLTDKLKTVTADGLGIDALEFAVQFQKAMPIPLHVIDMEYSFDLNLSDFTSGEDLMSRIGQ